MDKTEFNPIVNIAGISIEFDAIIFKCIPDLLSNFEKSYEFHNNPEYRTNDLVKVKIKMVERFPSLFNRMKDIGCNIRYKKTEDVERYCFKDINGNLKPITFSYDIRERLSTIFWVKGGEKTWVHPPGDRGLHHPFFNGWYDMLLYSAILSHDQGLFLHTVGISKKECEGVLVCGHSGDGKSTLAKKMNDLGYGVINDDCLVVRKNHRGFCFFPTPWRWKYSPLKFKYKYTKEGIYISSLFFLTKHSGKQSEIKPLSKKEVFSKLHEYILFYLSSKEKVLSYLELCAAIASQVKGFQLMHSLKDKSDPIRLIERCNTKLLVER